MTSGIAKYFIIRFSKIYYIFLISLLFHLQYFSIKKILFSSERLQSFFLVIKFFSATFIMTIVQDHLEKNIPTHQFQVWLVVGSDHGLRHELYRHSSQKVIS
jgi:hypothetical protein